MRAASRCVVRNVCRALRGFPRLVKTRLPAEERKSKQGGIGPVKL